MYAAFSVSIVMYLGILYELFLGESSKIGRRLILIQARQYLQAMGAVLEQETGKKMKMLGTSRVRRLLYCFSGTSISVRFGDFYINS